MMPMYISLSVFTPLELFIICHFIGDFILQNGWMATYKNKSYFVLGVHSFVYSITFIPLMIYYQFSLMRILISFLILLLSHYIIDQDKLFLSVLTRLYKIKLDEDNKIMGRIILLVNDQLWHLLVIVLIILFNIKH